MSVSKNLVSNTFYLMLDWGLMAVLSFSFWIVIWKNLPPFQVGIFSTAQNLIGLISTIAAAGFMSACTKLIPEYSETKKNGMINSLIRFVLVAISIISIAASVLVFIFAPQLSGLILDFPVDAMRLVSIGVILFTFEITLGSILMGFQDMKKYLITDIIGTACKLLLTVFLIFSGFQYVGPLLAFLIASLIITILRFDRKWIMRTKMGIDKKFIFHEYSSPSIIASIGPITYSNMPYIIVAFFGGLTVTGIFSTAIGITAQLVVIMGVIVSAIFPVVSQLSVHNNMKNKQNTIINTAIKYGLLITLPIVLVLVLTPRAIVLLLSQKNYILASDFFPLLSLSFLVMGLSNIFLSSLYAIGKTKVNRNIWILSSLIFFITSIPLTFYFSALGLSAAFLFSISLTFLISLFYLRKYLVFKLNWINIMKILPAALVFVAFIYFADYFQLSVFLKYFIAAIGVLVYFIVLIPLKFFDKNDLRVLRILSEQVPFLKNIFSLISKFISK